jgi:methylated-DNA-protein-cysteine methyltransferase-like protein
MYGPPDPKRFTSLVWDIVRQIPPGQVSTYAQIASMIPAPDGAAPPQYDRLGALWVGGAMAALPDEMDDVPWQRVINSKGEISPRPGAASQRALLEAEGVHFDGGRVDFERYGWRGPEPVWLEARGLFQPHSLGSQTDRRQLSLF